MRKSYLVICTVALFFEGVFMGVSAEIELETIYNNTYGGIGSDVASFAVETSDNGFLIIGNTMSYGAGDWDIWILKVDQDGAPLWNKTYGTNASERSHYIIQTDDGNYLIAARTNVRRGGDFDLLLLKVDPEGDLIWNRTMGGTGDEWMWEIKQTSDHGYALVGRTNSYGAGSNDYWLLKVDENGGTLLNKTFGGIEDERARSLLITEDGGYLVLGWSGTYSHGMLDFWLVKTDQNGVIQWNNSYGGLENERGVSIEPIDDGYVLAGSTNSFSEGGSDGYFLEIDEEGKMIWNRTYGGAGLESIHFILQSQSGYALVGLTDSFGAGDRDIYIILTDRVGNPLLEKTYGGPGFDGLGFGIKTKNGDLLVGGSTATNSSADDFLVLRLRGVQPLPEPEPANIIYKSLTTDASNILTGETVTITLTLENEGEVEGSEQVNLYINNEVSETRITTLGGGETKTEAFLYTPYAAGIYVVRIGGFEESFTAANPEPPGQEPDSSKSIPGFPMSSIILALILTYLIYLRSRRTSRDSRNLQ